MNARLERLRQALESAVSGMSSEQLNWHPSQKWSAAEVLEHLYLTYTGTIKGFDRVVAGGKPLATAGSLRHRLRKVVVLGFNYLPEGRQAPETTRPKGLGAEKVRNELAEKIQAMDAIIAQCEARFGRGVQLLDHPILGPLTATQWRKFHLLHGMHHHKQLLRLRQQARAKEKTS